MITVGYQSTQIQKNLFRFYLTTTAMIGKLLFLEGKVINKMVFLKASYARKALKSDWFFEGYSSESDLDAITSFDIDVQIYLAAAMGGLVKGFIKYQGADDHTFRVFLWIPGTDISTYMYLDKSDLGELE